MTHIKIQQLSGEGHVLREFALYPAPKDVQRRLHSITYAYNLDRTRVLLDGERVYLSRESAASREP